MEVITYFSTSFCLIDHVSQYYLLLGKSHQ